MQIIIDAKMPEKAKETLSRTAEIIELAASGITYEAISGHPDIFFFKDSSVLTAAPNIPGKYFSILKEKGIECIPGDLPVGMKYPSTAHYNAAASENYFIHRTDITDPQILSRVKGKEHIYVNQGYCRCSLLPLKNDSFITSDGGIFKALKEKKLNVLYVSAEEVILPGLKHGFFGGACGICDDTVFLAGSLRYHPEGNEIKAFLKNLHYKTAELYDGPLFDAGSIMFLDGF